MRVLRLWTIGLISIVVALVAAKCGAPPPHSLSSSAVDAGLCRPSAIDARAADGGDDAGACATSDAAASDHRH